jgi:hypothetical protein
MEIHIFNYFSVHPSSEKIKVHDAQHVTLLNKESVFSVHKINNIDKLLMWFLKMDNSLAHSS